VNGSWDELDGEINNKKKKKRQTYVEVLCYSCTSFMVDFSEKLFFLLD
jgi:hypothetical protein